MSDRLAEIKSGHLVGDDDVDWLIAEVKRQREDNDEFAGTIVDMQKRNVSLAATIERLESVEVREFEQGNWIAQGREAAAKIADEFAVEGERSGFDTIEADQIAAAIRAEIKHE